jgi:hypothetical protein
MEKDSLGIPDALCPIYPRQLRRASNEVTIAGDREVDPVLSAKGLRKQFSAASRLIGEPGLDEELC